MLFCLLSCGHEEHHHEHEGHHHEHEAEGHVHEEPLQLTAYGKTMEVFAEATPLVAGEESEIVAHFTHLNNFKPLEAGQVTARLVTGKEESRQTVEVPEQPGIYHFTLTPKTKGEGRLSFEIETADGTVTLTLPRVTVYDDEHEAGHEAEEAMATSSNGVAFTKEMSWKVEFATEQCRKEPFGKVIRTMARTAPLQSSERVVTAGSSGIVTFPTTDMVEGRGVKAGETLCYIGSGDMTNNNLAVRYREAESDYNLAKSEYERKAALAEDKIVSASDLLQAKRDYETAEAVYHNLRKNFTAGKRAVTAPLNGYVTRLAVHNGDYVEAGQPLATVSQDRGLYVKAEIQPTHYDALSHISDVCLRRLNGGETYSLQELEGSLVSYGKAVSEEEPLIPVTFKIDNALGLLPGTFVEIYIKTQGEEECITVANEALVEEMGNYFVYVQLTPEYFEKREVKVGSTDGKRTAILAGLTTDERVVSKGAVLVKLAQSTGTLDAHAGHVH